MLLSTLLLATAGTSAGCFNGGALVGAQAGFMRANLKQEAKAKPISEADAQSQVTKLLAIAPAFSTDADAFAKIQESKDDTYNVLVNLSSFDNATDAGKASAGAAFVAALDKAFKSDSFKTAKTFTIQILNKTGKEFAAADFSGLKVVTDFVAAENTKKIVATIVKSDQEVKYTSNNGFAGIHAGYLGRVNDKFLVGGLVEGNWVFGQDMKKDSVEQKDTSARFNVNVFLRAMFNLTEKFMAGADLGFSGQEIRQLKAGAVSSSSTKSSDKESKWFWNPAARLVLGVALTENILATAHFGGVFPMMKQDSLDKSVKAKYSNFHGGVGISYAFGG